MKKLLLLAVAALIAGSASAQKAVTKQKVTPKKMMTLQKDPAAKGIAKVPQFEMKDAAKMKLSKGPVVDTPKKGEMMQLNPKDMKFDPALKAKFTNNRRAAARRALAWKELYHGTATRSGSVYNWDMIPTTVDTGDGPVPALTNLVICPWEYDIDVEYEAIDDNNFVIPFQFTGISTGDYYVFIANWSAASVDGSIPFTMDNYGNITCGTNYIAWVAVPKEGPTYTFDDAVGSFATYQKPAYVAEGAEYPPTASYDINDAVYYSGISHMGYNFTYQHVAVPAYGTVNFTNLTTDPADTWAWTVNTIYYNEDTEDFEKRDVVATGDQTDFNLETQGGEYYAPAELVASLTHLVSEPFVGAEESAIVYPGSLMADWSFGDDDAYGKPQVTRANLKYPMYYSSYMGTDQGIKSWILYQGAPTKPLYFEGVNMMVRNFVAGESFNLKCKIVKVERPLGGKLTIGDVIAESEVNTEQILTNDVVTELFWTDFGIEDELGLFEPLNNITIEPGQEFAIVIEGWDNGTFTADGLYFDGGPETGTTSTYVIISEEDEYSGYGFHNNYGHIMVGLEGAVYGYMQTTDNTNLTIPADGGEAKIHILPMLYQTGDDGQPATLIYLDESSEEIPDWLQVSYTEPTVNGEDVDLDFDLIFAAQALPAGTTSRSCNLVFFQPGAYLEVSVSQSGVAGVSTVVKKTVTDGPAYNLNGQRVNANYKGIVVKDGAKAIKK